MRKKTDCFWLRTSVMLFLLLFVSLGLFAQKVVTGKVISSKDNLPLPYATVTVKGTNVATTSDASGNFTITMPNGRSTLVVSSVGFANAQVDASSGNVSVTLNETTSSLDEIVVTGYTAQKKKDITGSVAVVNVQNLKSVPSGSTESLLQGQAAGVTVISSGVPGGGSNVRIRGITSLGSADPLYVIDGVQSANGIHDLDPNSIESIQVLKDAGAAAIYGIQGSNGVIIVTTKKGRGKPTISYDAYIGTQRPLSGNPFHLANTPQYAQAIWDMETNSAVKSADRTGQFGHGTAPVIPDYILPEGAMEGDPGTSPADYVLKVGQSSGNNQIMKANKTGTDWFHEVFKPAMIQSHTISASAGSDKSSYFFSVNYFNQEGTLIDTYLKRYSARMNTTFAVGNHIRVGENAYVFYKQNPGFPGGNLNEGNAISFVYRIPPIIPVYDIMGNYAGTQAPHLSNAENPVANQQRLANNNSNDWQVNGNVFAEVDLLKNLTARTSFGGTFDNYYYRSFTYTAYERAEGNTNSNNFQEGAGYNSQWIWTNTLNYSNVFGNHTVKVLVGSEAKKVYDRGFNTTRSNYFSTDPNYWTLNTGDPASPANSGGSPYQLALYSLFGRLDYSYMDKYLLSGTFRRDGASVFHKGNQYGNFPSITAGWRISSESFMKGVTWLSELKLRGGWGKLGSISNIGQNNPYTLYASGVGYSYYPITGSYNSSTMGFYASQIGNPQTTWENDIVTNIGLDASVFKNKFDFSIEWYQKKISGLLFQAVSTIGAYAGSASQPFVNFGNIENHGIDASLTYHANITRDFSFDVTGTFTSYKSKVVSLPEGYKYVDQNSNGSTRIGAFTRTQPGEPIGEFFGYKVVGLFQDAEDVAKSPAQDGSGVGRFKFADVNGDGKITTDDRTWIGNPNPDFTYGLNIGLKYKSFDLSAFFYGSQGNQDFNFVKYWTDFPEVFRGNVSTIAIANTARIVDKTTGKPTALYIDDPNNPGALLPNPNAKVGNPSATTPVFELTSTASNSSSVNSYYVEDGSYFRCKQLQVGYTLPTTTLNRFGINRFRIYLQVANLFTITKYTGLDPELQASDLSNNSNFGIDFGNYPGNQKEYLVGVNVNF